MTKTEDFTMRIRLSDYRRAKRIMKPYPKETMANYFERLVDKLESYKNDRT